MEEKIDFPDIREKGVYCLIFRNEGCVLDAGRLRDIEFRKGYYVYVGSALGPGGLKRLKRHVLLSLKKDKKPRWHVDYLSVSSVFDLLCVTYIFSEKTVECRVAEKLQNLLNNNFVSGFGCGDCKCSSHLYFSKTCPLHEIETAFSEMKMSYNIVCFKE